MKTIANWLKSLVIKPTARQIAERELEEAKRQHLRAQAQAEAEFTQQMLLYHDKTVRRLTAYLKEESK